MTDLLVRDVDPELKRALAERARASGRSLSDEAKTLLRDAIREKPPATAGLGTSIRALVMGIGGVDLDIPPRDEYGREPPKFD